MAKRGRPADVPICGHSGREVYANGKCRQCSGASHATVPTCGHPGRKHMGLGKCKPCYVTAWMKAHPDANSGNGWRRQHPDQAYLYTRRLGLKRQGLTIEQYGVIYDAQAGRCANPRCKATAPKVLKDHRYGLQVDHDHVTGRFRGLLCPTCNLALGCVKDDTERLLGLAEYLSPAT